MNRGAPSRRPSLETDMITPERKPTTIQINAQTDQPNAGGQHVTFVMQLLRIYGFGSMVFGCKPLEDSHDTTACHDERSDSSQEPLPLFDRSSTASNGAS